MSEGEGVHSAVLIWAAAGFWQGRHSVGLRLLWGWGGSAPPQLSLNPSYALPHRSAKALQAMIKFVIFSTPEIMDGFPKETGMTCGKNRQPGAERMGRNKKTGRWAKGEVTSRSLQERRGEGREVCFQGSSHKSEWKPAEE